MLNKIKKPNRDGFTIIEVMIVLAIAGLILLIVLLAVPAVQRNSRNTTEKNDASTVAAAINTYESDNNGSAPQNITGTGIVNLYGGTTPCNGTASPNETINVNGSTKVTCSTTPPDSSAGSVQAGTIEVVPGKNCQGSSSTRAWQIWYAIETSGGVAAPTCVDS